MNALSWLEMKEPSQWMVQRINQEIWDLACGWEYGVGFVIF